MNGTVGNMEQNGLVPAKKQRLIAKQPVTVVLGTQWGDEGKGKIVDMIAADADICCRCQVCFISASGYFYLQFYTEVEKVRTIFEMY